MATIDERLGLKDHAVTRVQKKRFTDAGITIATPSGREFRIKVLVADPPLTAGENRLRMVRMYFTDSADGHASIHKSQMIAYELAGLTKRQRVKTLLRHRKYEVD